jgi:hypothetical protein
MNDFWHRVGVYWGLREDPDLKASWGSGRPDMKATLVGCLLALAVLIAVSSAVILIIRLIAGGETNPGSVVWGGTRLFFALAATWALVAGIVRWARWLWPPGRGAEPRRRG